MNTARWLAACSLAAALAAPATAAPLFQGSTVTGRVSVVSDLLLGAADGYAAIGGPVSTPVSGDIEFLTGDFALALDFDEGGGLTIQDNSGGLLLAGTYVFEFGFDGLVEAFTSFSATDLSGLVSGSLLFERLDGRSARLTATDLQFATAFGTVSAQFAIPQPGSLPLLGAALLGWALVGRSRRVATPLAGAR